MDKGSSLKEALKTVVETKLLGTYRLAIMEMENPDNMLFVKNSGDFVLGLSKAKDELVVSSDPSILHQSNLGWQQVPIPNNHILEVKSDCTYVFEKLEKKI